MAQSAEVMSPGLFAKSGVFSNIRAATRTRARMASAGLVFLAVLGFSQRSDAAPVTASAPAAPAGFQTVVPEAILVDFSTGAILFEKESDRRVAPGGLVKIMTAAVAFNQLQAGKLTLDTPFVVSVNAWRRGGAPAGGAAMFAEVNKPMRVEDLIIGALTVSGNDAAMTLAEGISGSEDGFATRMNELGAALSLTNTSFRNSAGFADPDQYTSAKDMAQLARYVIKTFPNYYSMFSVPEIMWSKIRQRNRNPLLTAGVGGDGLHVAWLKDVGYHIVGSAVQNDRRLIVVIMGAKSEKERLEETKRLLDWGFRSFELREVFAAGAELGRASVFGGDTGSVGLAPREPIQLLLPRSTQDKLVSKVIYAAPLRAPLQKGAEVARLEIFRGQMKMIEVPLITTADVGTGSMWQRAMDGAGVVVGNAARDIAGQIQAKLRK